MADRLLALDVEFLKLPEQYWGGYIRRSINASAICLTVTS